MMTDLKRSCKKVNVKGLIYPNAIHYYSACVYMASGKEKKSLLHFCVYQ